MPMVAAREQVVQPVVRGPSPPRALRLATTYQAARALHVSGKPRRPGFGTSPLRCWGGGSNLGNTS